MKMNFKNICAMATACMLSCLTGCGSVSTTSDVERYAREHFGKATMTSYEETEDCTIGYFTDDAYGFEYYVKNEMTAFDVDGAHFFDAATWSSNYPGEFFAYLEPELAAYAAEHDAELRELGIEIDYDGHIENSMKRADIATFTNVSEEDLDAVKAFADDYIEYFKSLDTMSVFRKVDVDISVIGAPYWISYSPEEEE